MHAWRRGRAAAVRVRARRKENRRFVRRDRERLGRRDKLAELQEGGSRRNVLDDRSAVRARSCFERD